MRALGRDVETLLEFGDRALAEDADAALERLVVELDPDELLQRRRGAADGDRLVDSRELESFEDAADVLADLLELLALRRVCCHVGLGEQRRADAEARVPG